MRKLAFCICENKDTDQLRGNRGNREADQRLCFHYTDSTIPLLSESKIFSPLAIFCGCGLCRTWSGTLKTGFSQRGSNIINVLRPWQNNLRVIFRSLESHPQKCLG